VMAVADVVGGAIRARCIGSSYAGVDWSMSFVQGRRASCLLALHWCDGAKPVLTIPLCAAAGGPERRRGTDERVMVERQVEAARTAARLSENHVIVVRGHSVFTSKAFNDHALLASGSLEALAGHVPWFGAYASRGRYNKLK
jgi:hypothetical protein